METRIACVGCKWKIHNRGKYPLTFNLTALDLLVYFLRAALWQAFTF